MPSRPVDFETQLSARVGQSVHLLDVPWSAERAERIRARVVQRKRASVRRHKQLRAGGAVAVLLAVVLVPRLWSALPGSGSQVSDPAGSIAPSSTANSDKRTERTPRLPGSTSELSPTRPPGLAPVATPREPGPPSSLRLADGSLASPRANSAVAVRQEQPARMVVELLHGAAEFSVTKNPARLFRVEAGGVAVEVLGTRFTVDKQPVSDGFRVAVAVSEGRVRVLFAAQQAELAAGERAEFQVPASAPAPMLSPPLLPAVAPAPTVTTPTIATARFRHSPVVSNPAPNKIGDARSEPARWKQLASEGRFEQAYEQVFSQSGPPSAEAAVIVSPTIAVSHSAADLLLLADVARLSHHPAAAVSSLRQLLDRHSDDPRAPLAAFTLGRVLLDDLGQPREAAEIFRRTQALDGEGPMAQDALAREVEAWSRAGDASRCRERAREYLRRYPSGRRLQAVRHYADLPAE